MEEPEVRGLEGPSGKSCRICATRTWTCNATSQDSSNYGIQTVDTNYSPVAALSLGFAYLNRLTDADPQGHQPCQLSAVPVAPIFRAK